jgi:hypothetical protein
MAAPLRTFFAGYPRERISFGSGATFAAGLKADACLWTKRARYPASASHSGGAPVRRAFLPDRTSMPGTPAAEGFRQPRAGLATRSVPLRTQIAGYPRECNSSGSGAILARSTPS